MQLSVDFGQIALIIIQIIMLIITFFVHSRQLSAVDIEKRDRGDFGAKVAEALRVAQAALRGVELIEVEHYKALAAKHAKLLQDVEDLKCQILSLEESVKSLANKLASRQRADNAEFRRMSSFQPDEEINPPVSRPPKGEVDLEWLKAQGVAVPLSTAPQQPQNPPPNSAAFGKMVRG